MLSRRFGNLSRWFSNAPERDRLSAAIKDAEIAFSQSGPQEQEKPLSRSVQKHLDEARTYLTDKKNLHQGWSSLGSANRLMLLLPNNQQDPETVAKELLRETEAKLTGWRAKAITDLISNGEGEAKEELDWETVVHALKIRDDQFATDYFKLVLRRHHLETIIAVLVACVLAALLVLSFPLNNITLLLAVLLFGAIGASLSVARGLMKADLSAKIPAQKVASFVILVRPFVGAAAALVSFLLLQAKAIRIFDLDFTDPAVILSIATVSGFSERFIIGAIGKIEDGGEAGGKKKESGEPRGASEPTQKRRPELGGV
jgi:hypothetical protein